MSASEMLQALPGLTEAQLRELFEMMMSYIAAAAQPPEINGEAEEDPMVAIRALRGIIKGQDITHESIREERLKKYL